MNNLIIIGNGFDLAHGLKTSYHHFIEYLINKTFKEKTFTKLILEEYSIDGYISLIDYVKNGGMNEYHFRNRFIGSLIVDLSINNWCDIEAKYYKILSNVGKRNALYSNYFDLNSDFEYIRRSLLEYLKNEIKSVTPIESYSELFKEFFSQSTTVLNFNYTNTIQSIYTRQLPVKYKTIHIHGEIRNLNNPIIFGYAATNEQSRTLIEEDKNENMRFIKKNLYKRTSNEYQLTNYLEDTEQIDLTILGHSCGISDNLILNQIFNHKNVRSIRFFYYEDVKNDPTGEEHFFQTQVNIDRIMNNDKRFRDLLIDYTRSTRMPQLNDGHEQKNNFIKYINEFKEEQESRKPHFGSGTYFIG